ncbi:MAG: cellulose binding domain-containing protein, partial [Candidatus Nanopelagicales bacterium]
MNSPRGTPHGRATRSRRRWAATALSAALLGTLLTAAPAAGPAAAAATVTGYSWGLGASGQL